MSQITVNPFMFVKLKQIKIVLSKELDDYEHMEPGERGSEISWNAVFSRLLTEHEEVKALRSKIISQDLEILRLKEGRGDEMKDLLEKTITNKTPIYVQVGAMAQSSTISGLSAPPLPPKNVELIEENLQDLEMSDDIKNDFDDEINTILDGSQILTPAQVMKIAKPGYKKIKIESTKEHDKRMEKHMKKAKKRYKKKEKGVVRRDSE